MLHVRNSLLCFKKSSVHHPAASMINILLLSKQNKIFFSVFCNHHSYPCVQRYKKQHNQNIIIIINIIKINTIIHKMINILFYHKHTTRKTSTVDVYSFLGFVCTCVPHVHKIQKIKNNEKQEKTTKTTKTTQTIPTNAQTIATMNNEKIMFWI